VTYTGETNERGEPHGQGAYEFADGTRYEGQLKDGEPHGQGVIEFADGDRHEGQFKDGEPHGQGVYEFADGERYEGQWKDGKRHGQMVAEYADGSRYEGQFKDGKMHGHGQGVYEYADGERYEGQFKDGKMHGQGVYEFADGSRYEGQFKDGKMHGQGVYEYADGSRYEGQFKDGEPHGQGGDDCGEWLEPLLTPSERHEGIHDSCAEEITRYDLAVASGMCNICAINRATTTVTAGELGHFSGTLVLPRSFRHLPMQLKRIKPFPVCQECIDFQMKIEAWMEKLEKRKEDGRQE